MTKEQKKRSSVLGTWDQVTGKQESHQIFQGTRSEIIAKHMVWMDMQKSVLKPEKESKWKQSALTVYADNVASHQRRNPLDENGFLVLMYVADYG